MSKKEIMGREIRSIFIKADREAIEDDHSNQAQLSNTIMRVCRGATLFVVVFTPIIGIIQFDMGSFSGFITGLLYVLSLVFLLTPLLYVLIASIVLKK